MASISIKGVSKSFGSLEVLHGIDIDMPDRSFVVLVGPSGCGKTTLLRLVAGLEDLTQGQIFVGPKLVNDLSPSARDIAMVFQSYALYPHMTVRDNLGFHLRLARVPRAEREARIAKVGGILGIDALMERYPRALSGGQRQRVAMGRAIIREPQAFLFDEPLSNLDAQLRVAMRGEIKALQQRLGTTTIYVTHDQVEAMTMADLMVVMDKGRIVQMGPPLDVFDRPRNTFVARFIGSPAMNLIEGTVACGNGESWVDSAAGRLPLATPADALAGCPVVYGVRPGALVRSDAPGAIRGRVDLIEATGDVIEIRLAAGSGMLQIVFYERAPVRLGETIGVLPKPGLVHLFDAGTGVRLEGQRF